MQQFNMKKNYIPKISDIAKKAGILSEDVAKAIKQIPKIPKPILPSTITTEALKRLKEIGEIKLPS